MGISYTVNSVKVRRGDINVNYDTPVRQATWEYPFLDGLDIGSSVVCAINGTTMLTGKVKSIARRRPESTYEFMSEDVIAQAVEYWFAPEDLDAGYTWSNIDHLSLTKAILAYAGITAAQITDDWSPYPTFQFATGPEPFKVTIASAWDVVNQICQITGMHVYADASNQIHLCRTWKEPGTASVSFTTGATGTTKVIEYYRSDDELRNKVVVYGYQSCYAEAHATSPYVPTDFYKTAIISYDSIVDVAMAQETADLNLSRMNKLTENVILDVLGQTNLDALQTATITDARSVLSGDWFISQCRHSVSESGYTCRLTCSK